MTINYRAIQSVQIRDGVATQTSKVWWHGEDGPEIVNLDLHFNFDDEWENLIHFPQIYSLNKPQYQIDNNGFAVYDYEHPY